MNKAIRIIQQGLYLGDDDILAVIINIRVLFLPDIFNDGLLTYPLPFWKQIRLHEWYSQSTRIV